MLEQVSHFRITGRIGAGGMGVVYTAVDLRLNRAVALKLLPADSGLDRDRRQRFLHEAQAASALNHPNIVTIFEVDNAEGLDFIAMELVEGRSLQERIGETGLALDRAVSYATQIAEGLLRFFYDVSARGEIVWSQFRPGRQELWTAEWP